MKDFFNNDTIVIIGLVILTGACIAMKFNEGALAFGGGLVGYIGGSKKEV